LRYKLAALSIDARSAFWELHNCYDEEGSKTAAGIMQAHEFDLREWTFARTGEHLTSKDPVGRGVFQVACRINHSCSPNVYWSCRDAGCVSYYALRAIEFGEELTSHYDNILLYWAREARKNELEKVWRFKFRCSACALHGDALSCIVHQVVYASYVRAKPSLSVLAPDFIDF